MPSYSISGPSSGSVGQSPFGPITVTRNVAWETPAWSWSLWLKVGSSVFTWGVMSTNLNQSLTPSGVAVQLYSGDLYINLQSNQYLIGSPDSNWHHLVLTYDATDFRVYVDGALNGSPHALGAMTWGTGDLTIAGFGDTSTRLKDVRIYTAKLSSVNVSTLYTGADFSTNLLYNWRCNEGTGNTINTTPAGLTGTASGVGITWSTDVPSQNPGAPVTGLTAGVASLVSSGSAGIALSATEATSGTGPYTKQWQRQVDAGSYANLTNGGGVAGATTLSLTDGSATTGHNYSYRVVYTDSVSATATSNAVPAMVYTGGFGGGGAIPMIGRSPFIHGGE